MYGRLEVYGFTIEEGQQSYPRFSPSSHCPLTITTLGDSPNPNKTKKAGRLVAKVIVRMYLSGKERISMTPSTLEIICIILYSADFF